MTNKSILWNRHFDTSPILEQLFDAEGAADEWRHINETYDHSEPITTLDGVSYPTVATFLAAYRADINQRLSEVRGFAADLIEFVDWVEQTHLTITTD